jgi:hypothetical protein
VSQALTSVALIVPVDHPVVEGVRRACPADVHWALARAARYLNAGGDWEQVRGFVDEWLDYQSALELEQRVGL